MGIKWAVRGPEAAAKMAQYEAEQKAKKEAQGKMWRYRLKAEEKARITFVDGDLKNGVLDYLAFREHQLFMNGNYNNFFICTMDTEGVCPLCESGDSPSMVGVLTVIDHRTYTSPEGKTYKDQPRLFVAKHAVIKLLQDQAVKRGGLAGATYEVLRVGDKGSNVGTNFDFEGKTPLAELKKKYVRTYKKDGQEVTEAYFKPADYENELIYRSVDDLRKMGFGSKVIGNEAPPQEEAAPAGDMSDHM